MSKTSTYRGVTRNGRLKKNPWIAQVVVSGVNHYLGNFPTEIEAARAYDNAAYWFSLEGFRTGGLNFPSEYAGETSPPPMAQTRTAQAKHRARLETLGVVIAANETRTPEVILLDRVIEEQASHIKSLKQLRAKLSTTDQTQSASSNLSPVTPQTSTLSSALSAPSTWKCPSGGGCEAPCDCKPLSAEALAAIAS